MLQTMQVSTVSADIEHIAAKIKDYIIYTFLYDQPGFRLTNESSLVDDGVLDSMRIVQLMTYLQQEFQVRVQPDDLTLENFGSVQAMAALVARYQQTR